MDRWKISFLLGRSIVRGYFSFREGIHYRDPAHDLPKEADFRTITTKCLVKPCSNFCHTHLVLEFRPSLSSLRPLPGDPGCTGVESTAVSI